MTKKILGILDCDEIAPPLIDEYQNYGVMFTQLLEPFSEDWELQSFRVIDDVWPSSISSCDAYLITGSKTGVYDSDPWLAPLRAFVVKAYEASKPLIGVCFGHQFLANSLGGKAEKSPKGWGVANREVFAAHSPEWMRPALSSLNLLYSHQDQVTALPDEATILFGDSFCPMASFCIPDRALAFQGHPEFTTPYMKGLMAIRKANYAEGQYEQGLESLEKEHDGPIVARWMFQFLNHAYSQASDNNQASDR